MINDRGPWTPPIYHRSLTKCRRRPSVCGAPEVAAVAVEPIRASPTRAPPARATCTISRRWIGLADRLEALERGGGAHLLRPRSRVLTNGCRRADPDSPDAVVRDSFWSRTYKRNWRNHSAGCLAVVTASGDAAPRFSDRTKDFQSQAVRRGPPRCEESGLSNRRVPSFSERVGPLRQEMRMRAGDRMVSNASAM